MAFIYINGKRKIFKNKEEFKEFFKNKIKETKESKKSNESN